MPELINSSRRSLFRGKIPKRSLRLPWVESEELFVKHCTQCQDCIKACETQIIVKDAQGFPTIDFSKGECTFCNKCVESCEQPLFVKDIGQREPWPITLLIDDQCLAKNDIYCQSCRDECETNAIKFSYSKNGQASAIPQPQLNNEDCTQCGACISTCPQSAINILFDEKNKEKMDAN